MPMRAPWTVIFPGSVGAYREDGLDWVLPTAVFGIGHDLSEMLTTLEAFWRASWSSLLGAAQSLHRTCQARCPASATPQRPAAATRPVPGSGRSPLSCG